MTENTLDSINSEAKSSTKLADFKTPEQIQAKSLGDSASRKSLTSAKDENLTSKLKNKQNKSKWYKFKLTKKQKIYTFSTLGVIIVLLLVIFLATAKNPSVTKVLHKNIAKSLPVTSPSNLVPSTLTGSPVNPSYNARPVMAVMIENTPYARPQSGLSKAGVVFEALTEGGITRFLAIFQNHTPSSIGPVRSVRPYFLDWADGFDPVFVHVGGSQAGLAYINTLGIRNIDQISDSQPFTRITSRPAPHNVYTSLNALLSNASSNGWTSSNYQGFPRLSVAPKNNKPIITSIVMSPSYSTYESEYSYNQTSNTYLRSEDNTPLTDLSNNQTIAPKVVIAMIVPWSQGNLDTSNAYYSVYQDIGSGQAYIFQNGNVTIGQWSKTSPTSQISFTDTNGNIIKLDPGQTWITVLSDSSQLNYN